ncbi:MAG: ABC transporter substrate-binding protein [Betaproteobacteria bacterium]|nr:ABC transporter substrate-binding protein [Betaproteobacteria bacterium]
MNRRDTVLALLGLGAAPLAGAQQTGKTYRVGYLQTSSRKQQLHLVKAFEDGLVDHGYRIGQNIIIEYRFADGNVERLPGLAAELAQLKVDVFLTGANPPTVAARQSTKSIPIVMAFGNDPVGSGLVASLARPAGNITGLTSDTGDEIYGKRLELLREVVPKLSRVAVLWNADYAPNRNRLKLMNEIAPKLKLELLSKEMRGPDDFKTVFDAIANERVHALLLMLDTMVFNYRDRIGSLVTKHRLPAISEAGDLADAGLLLTYGVNARDLWRQAAAYVDKILKGANPADLPVAQPTKFELVVNLKTAKALGLKIPQSVLLRVDRAIE